MLITSLENKKIKELVKLKNKKYRDKTNLFIVETTNLVNEAYKNNLLLEVYKLEDKELDLKVPTYDVTKEVMNKIKEINTSSILGLCKKKESTDIIGDKILLLDNIQDPGNLGTIIRTSLAFDVTSVILSNTTCDVYNDKTIRASEGAIFKQNIIRMNLKEAIKLLKERNIPIFSTDVETGINIDTIKTTSYAVIMGNEGNGVSAEINNLIENKIYIPISKNQESLNVGVATGIILYSLSRR